MSPTLGVIVRCGGASRYVWESVRSVARQTHAAVEVVVVTDTATPPLARDWISHTGRRFGWRVVHTATTTPGAAWNAGLEAAAADAVTCVDAGDRLTADHHAVVSAALVRRADLVTTALLLRPLDAPMITLAPPAVDDGGLRAAFVAHRHPWTVRRSAWTALGGFDPDLPALEDHELLLRARSRGHQVATVASPHVVRPLRREALYRQAWDTPHHDAAVQRILERHAAFYEVAPADALAGGLALQTAWATRHETLLARRDAALAELDGLRRRAAALRASPPGGARALDLGDLRRTSPVSRDWGYERGAPVDRRYIEAFLQQHAVDVRGAVLEVQEPDYTLRLGGDRVTRSDVIDADPGNSRATIVSDLRAAANIPADHYDCIILTQTLHVIDDMPAVAAECARILKPGGVLLATLPCASRVSVEYGPEGDFWRVSEAGAREVFARAFRPEDVTVASVGNVLTTTAFLYGLGDGELTPDEYAFADPFHPTLITVRATRAGAAAPTEWPRAAHLARAVGGKTHSGAAVLLYHRVAQRGGDVHGLAVAPEEFAAQLESLKSDYDVVPLADLGQRVRDGTVTPGLVAITFDDGYLDNLETASPLLLRAGLPATFFVTTDRLTDPGGYWWDALAAILLGGEAATPHELSLDLPLGRRHFSTATAAERDAAHWTIYHAIVGASGPARDELMAALHQWVGSETATIPRRMSAAQIHELALRHGHDIGAHSVSHVLLPRQPADVQHDEAASSYEALAELLGRPVTMFAYPFGAWDATTRAVIAAAGTTLAVACGDAAVPRRPDLLALPRLDVVGRGHERFDDWMRRRVAPPPGRRSAAAPVARGGGQASTRGRAIVAGWFSYADSDSTAGDLLACELVCEWLRSAGIAYDIAYATPYAGGVDLAQALADDYSHAVFVCGPFVPGSLEREFLDRFAACTTVGVNLSMPVPLADWQPFDVLLERDSSRAAHADVTFGSPVRQVPVVGVCQVEPFGGADVAAADRAIERLLASREVAVVPIDTRTDANATGLRSPAEIEALIARMDVVVTTRLHGTVLALKHGVPVVAIDPEPGAARLLRQAAAIGWPHAFAVDRLDDKVLGAAFDNCLTAAARAAASACAERARRDVEATRNRFLASLEQAPQSGSGSL